MVNDLDGVLTEFDRVIGLEAMKRIALHPALAGHPFILETPNDDEGYIEEIHTVLSWLK